MLLFYYFFFVLKPVTRFCVENIERFMDCPDGTKFFSSLTHSLAPQQHLLLGFFSVCPPAKRKTTMKRAENKKLKPTRIKWYKAK